MNYDIQLVHGCCEPGYDDKPVAIANWNDRTSYNPISGKCDVTDDTMPRIAKLLEKLGYECEWEDEWYICDDCGKAVRSSADSYSWKQYFWLFEHCGIVCGDCVKQNPDDYLEWLSGNADHCLLFDIDLEDYGYRKHSGDYESGLHPGQNSKPKDIAKQLREEGITDFIFVLDDVGQFDISFSVWVKNQEDDDDD